MFEKLENLNLKVYGRFCSSKLLPSLNNAVYLYIPVTSLIPHLTRFETLGFISSPYKFVGEQGKIVESTVL